jgi:hypothetical protein
MTAMQQISEPETNPMVTAVATQAISNTHVGIRVGSKLSLASLRTRSSVCYDVDFTPPGA